MRVLYADFSPGYGWDGRDPEALEVATATQASVRTVSSFLAAGLAALETAPRPLAFFVDGTTPAHAPASVVITGTVDGVTETETVVLPTSATHLSRTGAVSGRKAFAALDSVVYAAGSGTGATVAIGLGLIPGVADLRIVSIETWLEGFRDKTLARHLLDVTLIDEVVRAGATKIDGALAVPISNYPTPFDPKLLGDLSRIARDFCLAEAGKLRPNVMQVDYVELRKTAQIDLDKIKKAYTGTGEPAGTAPVNIGGAIVPTQSPPRRSKFGPGKWGIF